jgi:hypothetical protein
MSSSNPWGSSSRADGILVGAPNFDVRATLAAFLARCYFSPVGSDFACT